MDMIWTCEFTMNSVNSRMFWIWILFSEAANGTLLCFGEVASLVISGPKTSVESKRHLPESGLIAIV